MERNLFDVNIIITKLGFNLNTKIDFTQEKSRDILEDVTLKLIYTKVTLQSSATPGIFLCMLGA
jgi:hypothetical protein